MIKTGRTRKTEYVACMGVLRNTYIYRVSKKGVTTYMGFACVKILVARPKRTRLLEDVD
jgi:hypothetical protein